MNLSNITKNALYLLALSGVAGAVEFSDPVRIEAAGKPVDTGNIGHAAPFICDFDGDGVRDLLVGEFSGGTLWIYHNDGSNKSPKFAEGVKFKDGADDGTVPYG